MIEEAKRRREAFENLPRYLELIVATAKEVDRNAEVYLFGSVAEGRHLLSSDIDVLVVTEAGPGEVLPRLWERGVGTPFEIHVVTRDALEIYRKRAKLIRAEDYVRLNRGR